MIVKNANSSTDDMLFTDTTKVFEDDSLKESQAGENQRQVWGTEPGWPELWREMAKLSMFV